MVISKSANSPGSSGALISIVVADDYPVVRSGIVHELERQPDIAVRGAAPPGDEALHLAQTLQPEVLLLDLRMPGLEAIEVVRQIRALALPTRVVMLTAYGDPDLALRLLKAGVHGYLLKDEPLPAFSNAVRAVMRGEMPLSADVAAHVVRQNVLGAAEQAQPELTIREQEVLRLLAKQKSNQEIGELLNICERTVRFHLRNIYDKLEVPGHKGAIAWAIRHGLDQE